MLHDDEIESLDDGVLGDDPMDEEKDEEEDEGESETF